MESWTDNLGTEYILANNGCLYKRVYDPDGEDNPDDVEIGHVHDLERMRDKLLVSNKDLIALCEKRQYELRAEI